MFIDPDGRKAQYLGSECELFGVENSEIIAGFQRLGNGFGNFSSFLGDNTSFLYKSAGSDGGGGGGSIYSFAGEEGVGFTGVYAQMVLNFMLDQISSTGGD